MLKKSYVVALAAIIALAAAAVAVASSQVQQTGSVKLTPATEGKSAGMKVQLDVTDPGEENNKPTPKTKIAIALPKGTKVNSKGAAQCLSNGKVPTEAQVKDGLCEEGKNKGSNIGSGKAIASAAPIIARTQEKLTFYNTKGGFLVRLTDDPNDPAPGQSIVLFAKAKGNKITINVPPLNAVPGVHVAILELTVNTKKKSRTVRKGGKRKKYNLMTAGTCGKSKKFNTSITVTYKDGIKKTNKTTTACKG